MTISGARRPSAGGWLMMPAGRVSLLDGDPELGRAIAADRWQVAHRALAAPAFRLARGPLPLVLEPPPRNVSVGYLIVKGILVREVSVAGRPSAELLAQGDLVRPWADDNVELLPRTVSWTVAESAVVLDIRETLPLGEWPGVLTCLIERALSRAESMALQRSISAQVRVDVRLLAFLWHLAERWGVVLPGAVRIELPLTHATLGRMVGARRPTVTTALQRLMQLDYIRREGSAYLVIGDATAVAELGAQSPIRAEAERAA